MTLKNILPKIQQKILNKNKIIQDIKSNVPLELLQSNIWIAYYFKPKKDGTFTKPPCSNKGYSVENESPGVTFEQACKDGFPGIKLNKTTPYIAFDIDDIKAKHGERKFSASLLSIEFKDFLKKYPSYIELSPSKCGLRVLYKCPDKEVLNSSSGRANLNQDFCIGGELFTHSGFVTLTGMCVKNSRELSEIRSVDACKWVTQNQTKDNLAFLDKDVKKDEIVRDFQLLKLPRLSAIKEALDLCLLDQNEKVQEAYKQIIGQDYNHYDYWLRVLSACHDFGIKASKMADMTQAVVNWSSKDSIAYQGEDDVLTHWKSLSEKESNITFHTLFKFAKLLRFQWPKPAYDKKGNPTGGPAINESENFEYLMNYYNIKLCIDIFSNQLYIKADESILIKYFQKNKNKSRFFDMIGSFATDELKYLFWSLAQDNGYINVALNTISPLFRAYFYMHVNQINLLEMWLKTEPENLPKDMQEKNIWENQSNLEYLLSCITFHENQDRELAKKYFETFFFEMMMPIYNINRLYAQRSFMLILTGPENCRKTTFFSMLFPPNLRRIFITNSTETLGGAKSIRDFAASLVNSALVVTDEFEIFYNKKNDSLFKTYVTSDTVDYTPIYEKTAKKEYKNAVLAGTTNKRTLPFEQDNNRRLAMIDVKWIDTSKMERINWHSFYRHFVSEGFKAMENGIQPWKLSNELIQKQYKINERFRSKSNIEIILNDLFDFGKHTHSDPLRIESISGVQSNDRLCKLRNIMGIITQNYPKIKTSPAEMKHVLERLCGKYTHTTNRQVKLTLCKGYVENGVVKQGQYTRYIMPPRLTDFSG